MFLYVVVDFFFIFIHLNKSFLNEMVMLRIYGDTYEWMRRNYTASNTMCLLKRWKIKNSSSKQHICVCGMLRKRFWAFNSVIHLVCILDGRINIYICNLWFSIFHFLSVHTLYIAHEHVHTAIGFPPDSFFFNECWNVIDLVEWKSVLMCIT